MALSGTGNTYAPSDWLSRGSSRRNVTDIRYQQVFNPVIVGTTGSNDKYAPMHAGLTLQAGVRLKNHGGDSQSIMIGVKGITVGGATNEFGYELRPGEEMFLEVNNLNLVSQTIAVEGQGSTLSYIGT